MKDYNSFSLSTMRLRPIAAAAPSEFLGYNSNRSYKPAITSISTSASFGSRATCTVDLAGGADGKYLA